MILNEGLEIKGAAIIRVVITANAMYQVQLLFIYVYSFNPHYEIDNIIITIPVLQMRKLRHCVVG